MPNLKGEYSPAQLSKLLTLREYLDLGHMIDATYKRYNMQFNVMRIVREEEKLIVFCRIDGGLGWRQVRIH